MTMIAALTETTAGTTLLPRRHTQARTHCVDTYSVPCPPGVCSVSLPAWTSSGSRSIQCYTQLYMYSYSLSVSWRFTKYQ